ncbi:MAG: peptide deformylase [Acidobacteriota bacterium]
MAVRPIVRLGHPALRTPARAVDLERVDDTELQQLIDDLFETMQEADGVGLAAPQVGVEEQLFVWAAIDPDRPPAETEGPELHVVLNPGIEPQSRDLVSDWEGCLSIPDLRGLVPRHAALRLHGFDRHGERIERTLEGYEARIVQHEFDHLNGIVFLDRMRDLRSLAFSDEWRRYMTADDVDDDEPAVG